MDNLELQTILEKHKLWLQCEVGGERADLSWANLTGASLTGANLTEANLTEANLTEANLTEADLTRANLTGANLTEADLTEANLTRADLTRADLMEANLTRADLTGASLTGANLTEANLTGADLMEADLTEADLTRASLTGANLMGTCLDSDNRPTGADDSFEIQNGYAIGYRTETAGHVDKYRVGRSYSADFFSTSETECHPGLYLWPTLEQANVFNGAVPMIKVRTRPEAIHKAGKKYRCQWFEVLEVIKND